MDYKRIYDDLMGSRLLIKEDRIKLKKMGEYFESHHIIPKSMGGLGDVRKPKDANIVLLTGREHYIAHALLFLIYRNREMAIAFRLMCTIKKVGKRNYVISSRMYEFIRQEVSRLGHSPEHKEKIRQSLLGNTINLGRKISSETKERLRQVNLGRKHSPETKEKLRKSHTGKKLSPEHKEKLRQANLGRKMSPESREKMRQARLGKKHSFEHVKNVRQANLGRKMSPETKEKIRQAQLGKKHSPEAKNKIGQASLGRKLSPESIKKSTETRKRNRLLELGQKVGHSDQAR